MADALRSRRPGDYRRTPDVRYPLQVISRLTSSRWHHLQHNGIPPPTSNANQGPLLTEHQLQTAIASLQASTHKLQTQTETLTKQKAILTQHPQSLPSHQPRTASPLTSLQRKQATQSQQTHLLNAAKLSTLKSHLQTRLSQLEKQAKSFPPITTEQVNTHDRLLSDLETQVNATSSYAFHPTSEIARAELLLQALENAQVHALKDRLDQIYLENLYPPPADSPFKPPHEGDDAANPNPSANLLATLKAEIQSLHTEIPAVAAMQIAATHGNPLRLALGDIESAQTTHTQSVLRQTRARITALTDSLDALTMAVRENGSQRHVINRMLGYLEGIEREATTPSTISNGSAAHTSGPTAATTREVMRTRTQSSGKPEGSSSHSCFAPGVDDGMFQTPPQREHTDYSPFASLLERMQDAAQRRRDAVVILATASQPRNPRDTQGEGEIQGEIKALEARIEVARLALEETGTG